jgi:hypothetical protein
VELKVPLDQLIANRRWCKSAQPFPHVVVEGLFNEEFAEELNVACNQVLASENLRHFGWYDATAWGFRKSAEWPLSVFMTKEWCDLLASALGVKRSPQVGGGIHHHDVGSASGSVHSDYNPVYFPHAARDAGVQLSEPALVNYQFGTTPRKNVKVHRVVRAVSVLYYLDNPPWRQGDGGETGLYRYRDDPLSSPARAVPPRNNTLLMFEDTPRSFHTFLTNRRSPRRSVVMWLHREVEDAEILHGLDRLETWPQ